jgi:hypothetical protein
MKTVVIIKILKVITTVFSYARNCSKSLVIDFHSSRYYHPAQAPRQQDKMKEAVSSQRQCISLSTFCNNNNNNVPDTMQNVLMLYPNLYHKQIS